MSLGQLPCQTDATSREEDSGASTGSGCCGRDNQFRFNPIAALWIGGYRDLGRHAKTISVLVAIVLRFEGAIDVNADVFCLVRAELGQLRTELAEM